MSNWQLYKMWFYFFICLGPKVKFGGLASKTCWDGCWNQESWYGLANASLWKLQQVYQCYRYYKEVILTITLNMNTVLIYIAPAAQKKLFLL